MNISSEDVLLFSVVSHFTLQGFLKPGQHVAGGSTAVNARALNYYCIFIFFLLQFIHVTHSYVFNVLVKQQILENRFVHVQ